MYRGFVGTLFKSKWRFSIVVLISMAALLLLAYTIVEICPNNYVNELYKDLYQNKLNQTAEDFAYVGGPLLVSGKQSSNK